MTDKENKTDWKKANEYVEKTGNNDCTIDAFIDGLKTGRHEINAGIEMENEKLKAKVSEYEEIYADIIECFASASYNDCYEMECAGREVYMVLYGDMQRKELFHEPILPESTKKKLDRAEKNIKELKRILKEIKNKYEENGCYALWFELIWDKAERFMRSI